MKKTTMHKPTTAADVMQIERDNALVDAERVTRDCVAYWQKVRDINASIATTHDATDVQKVCAVRGIGSAEQVIAVLRAIR